MSNNFKSGQIGLLLLIIMGLVIGLVLSIASRSLTDTVLSRQEKENVAAFSLAESGVETALLKLTQGTTELDWTLLPPDSTGVFNANYAISASNSFEMYLKEGESVEVDLTLFPGAVLDILWTKSGKVFEEPACTGVEGSGNSPAALGITVVTSSDTVRRGYFNPYNSISCGLDTNGFSGASAGSNGFRSATSVNKVAGDKVARFVPIYNGATLRVSGTGLTEAMFKVSSVAVGGDVQKEIEVKRSRDAAGSIFDYALFSGSTIVKN